MFRVPLDKKLIEKANSLKIRPADIEEQFVRGSGHGGQKVNKTSSTVLLKHRPTGITVRCQQYREQSKNRLAAYKLLIQKIEEKVRWNESQRAKAIFKLKKQKKRRSRRAKEKMLEAKHRRSDLKEQRRKVI